MSELLSLVLTLQLLNPAGERESFPRWWGRASQAAFLQIVDARRPDLAQALHDEPGPRPYTVSTLMGRFARNGAPLPDETYRLRWTALTTELSALLRDFAAAAVGTRLELDGIPLRVVEATFQGDQAWVGSDSYAALGSRFLPGVAIPRRVAFQFTSPVVFKSGGLTHPLPTPSLVFHSLLERWNAFAPIAFMSELRRYAEECLAISRFNLKSRPVPLKGGGLRIGAVGSVTFTATNFDRFWLGQIHTLAAFALYAGVGAGTAQGLGQARRVER